LFPDCDNEYDYDNDNDNDNDNDPKERLLVASTPEYDALIIGAGMSGLAAGIRLAHFGRRVLLCERHHQVGGLNSWYRRDGLTLDSGLHAMTNFAPRSGPRGAPLLKLLRQLRLPHEALALREQTESRISFPEKELRFSNDFELLSAEVAREFPAEHGRFLQFDALIRGYDALNLDAPYRSARQAVNELLQDPLLAEMLFCPLMYYGSAVENDMDFAQFAIMYQSIFHEGFCRPANGMRPFLDLLAGRCREAGCEIRTNCGVDQVILRDGKAVAARLSDGTEVLVGQVFSSAGRVETLGLCAPPPAAGPVPVGRLGFFEVIARLARPAARDGFTDCIRFFNTGERFAYAAPATAVDGRSGVLCCPANFRREPGDDPPSALLRITALASPEHWLGLSAAAYPQAKEQAARSLLAGAAQETGIPGLADAWIVDAFTPRTIRRYTGRVNGAIYGSPDKAKDGRTPVDNLFLIGTDQGFLGITGAMLSGISIANQYGLK
jgi:phytoene dehydrogenase-like protein